MPNATQLLRQDHKKVQGLFKKFDQAKGMDAKRRFAAQAMSELEVHAAVEEEIFYPAVKQAIDETELVDEAEKEHQEAKSLIGELKAMQGQNDGEGDNFESKFSKLQEAIQHHVEEEEGEMFPKVEESELDLADLGTQMAQRKQELMLEMDLTKQSGSKSKSKRKTRTKAKSKSKSARRTKARSSTGRKSSGGKRARAR
jgi:hemerythrin superfamily protein